MRAAQTDGFEFHQHDLAQNRFGQFSMFADWEGDVFEYRKIGQQSAGLKQHAHALAQLEQLVGF